MEQAKNALQSELAHAMLGIEYWSAKASYLRDMISKIDNIERNSNATKKNHVAQESLEKARLPTTGRDFWISQFSEIEQTSAKILDKAIQNLRISPIKETKKRLASRLATAIQILTKDGTVIAHGEGKRRTFTRS